MSKVTAPFLAFTARGRIGRAVVATRRTGSSIMQPYVVPSNPNTPAQAAQRFAFSTVAAHWSLPATPALNHPAWTLTATRSLKPATGYNAFFKNALPAYLQDPGSSFADVLAPTPYLNIYATMFDLDTHTTATETGNFHLWAGPTPATLALVESAPLNFGNWAGIIPLGSDGDMVFVNLRKGGYDRSGIYRVTIFSGGP